MMPWNTWSPRLPIAIMDVVRRKLAWRRRAEPQSCERTRLGRAPLLREVRQQGAEGHAQRTLDVQVEASVLIQVNVAEKICSVGWTLQHRVPLKHDLKHHWTLKAVLVAVVHFELQKGQLRPLMVCAAKPPQVFSTTAVRAVHLVV